MELPGVGRKTAACVMVYGFGDPAIPVDPHVHRLANRMGVIQTGKPEDTEKALGEITHSEHVRFVNELLEKHGQSVCRPAGPSCERCPVRNLRREGSRSWTEGAGTEKEPGRQSAGRRGDEGAQSSSRQASSRKDTPPLFR